MALKRILMHNEKEGMPITALREIKILKALKHPNIVEILDMFVVRSRSFIIAIHGGTALTRLICKAEERNRRFLYIWCFRTWTTI